MSMNPGSPARLHAVAWMLAAAAIVASPPYADAAAGTSRTLRPGDIVTLQSGVVLRASASDSAPALAPVVGTTGRIVRVAEGWAEVSTGSDRGWLPSRALAASESRRAMGSGFDVEPERRAYREASSNAPLTLPARAGDHDALVEGHGDWLRADADARGAGIRRAGVLPRASSPLAAPTARATTIGYSTREADLVSSPSATSPRLARVMPSSRLTIVLTNGVWTQVQTMAGEVGWISTRDLRQGDPGPMLGTLPDAGARSTRSTLEAPAIRVGSTVPVSDGRELLSRADASSTVAGRVSPGARVLIVASHDEWLKVRSDRGVKGWILASDLSGAR